MSTVTSVILDRDLDQQNGSMYKTLKRKKSKKLGGVTSNKLCRMLFVERKTFYDRLHSEREMRLKIETWAAQKVQAVYRGHHQRKGDVLENKQARTRNQTTIDDNLKRQLLLLQKLTGKILNSISSKKRKMNSGAKKREDSYLKYISAIKVQSAFQNFMARKTFKVAKMYQQSQIENRASLSIQSRFRGHLERSKSKARDVEYVSACAVLIQSHVRKYLDRKFVQEIRNHMTRIVEKQTAAIKLQNQLRSKIAKEKLTHIRREKSTNVIQSRVRGHLDRCKVKNICRKQSSSAVTIQSKFRGVKMQRKHQQELADKRAAELEDEKIKEHARSEQRRSSATLLQSLFRGRCQRKQDKQHKSVRAATIIQSKARQSNASKRVSGLKETRHKKRAATNIQKMVRRKSANAVYQLKLRDKQDHENASATDIQAAYRGKMCRDMVVHIRNARIAKLLEDIDKQLFAESTSVRRIFKE